MSSKPAARDTLEPERTFRSPLGTHLLVLGTCVLFPGVALIEYRADGLSATALFLGALGVLALVGLADTLTTRVALYPDRLVIRTNFRTRIVPRKELQRVTWEKGMGVALRRHEGGWVKLPHVGNSQSITNAVRAWLKRTTPEE